MAPVFVVLVVGAQAVTLPQPRCDIVEVNHCYDHDGDHVLDQLIFWQWCPCRCRYVVQAWWLQDSCRIYYNHGWVVYVKGRRQGVRVRHLRETWTQYDPEVLNRRVLPRHMRSGVYYDPEVLVRDRE